MKNLRDIFRCCQIELFHKDLWKLTRTLTQTQKNSSHALSLNQQTLFFQNHFKFDNFHFFSMYTKRRGKLIAVDCIHDEKTKRSFSRQKEMTHDTETVMRWSGLAFIAGSFVQIQLTQEKKVETFVENIENLSTFFNPFCDDLSSLES